METPKSAFQAGCSILSFGLEDGIHCVFALVSDRVPMAVQAVGLGARVFQAYL